MNSNKNRLKNRKFQKNKKEKGKNWLNLNGVLIHTFSYTPGFVTCGFFHVPIHKKI